MDLEYWREAGVVPTTPGVVLAGSVDTASAVVGVVDDTILPITNNGAPWGAPN